MRAEWHTLLLLDIKVKEQSIENMARGRLIYEEPRFMTINQCIEQLLYCESTDPQKGTWILVTLIKVCHANTIGVGLARVGADDQLIISGTFSELANADFGKPLHSFILPGKMHFMEYEALREYAINIDTFQKYASVHDC